MPGIFARPGYHSYLTPHGQLLEAMVERPPPRPLTDEFGLEITLAIPEQEQPSSPAPTSPSEPAKLPPRPYISRSRSSSSSILSMISPTLSSASTVDGDFPFYSSPTSATSPRSPLGLPETSTFLGASLSRNRSSSTAEQQ
jgi:protein phosphatase 1 regulatory subunit 37